MTPVDMTERRKSIFSSLFSSSSSPANASNSPGTSSSTSPTNGLVNNSAPLASGSNSSPTGQAGQPQSTEEPDIITPLFSPPPPAHNGTGRKGSSDSGFFRRRFQSVDTTAQQHKRDFLSFFSRFPSSSSSGSGGGGSRRKSVTNNKNNSANEIDQYETISPLLEVPSLTEFEQKQMKSAENTKKLFHKFFNRSPSPIPEGQEVFFTRAEDGAEGDSQMPQPQSSSLSPSLGSWKPPDSWAVHIPEPSPKTQDYFADVDFDSPKSGRSNRRHDSVSSMSGFIFYPPLDEDYFPTVTETLWSIRVFKPSPRKRVYNTMSRRGSTSGMTFATISCPYTISTAEICSILAKKFFIPDPEHYRLYVYYRGLERVLEDSDRPIMMQCKWLQELGYTEQDQLPRLGREEHGYYFWFSYNEFPSVNAPPSDFLEQQTTNLANDVRLESTSAHLVGLTLYMLPVALFKYTSTIESIDFSKNPMLSLPIDFFEQCVNLKTFRLSYCSIDTVPPAILYTANLTHLDLSNNLLKSNALFPLGALKNLTHLYLDNNFITDLPSSFSTLSELQVLSMSNNQLSAFPSILTESLLKLKEIDFNYNEINYVPNLIALKDLKILNLRGNKIVGLCELGDNSNLEFVDIRNNFIKELVIIPKCQKSLKKLLIDKNQISMLPNLNVENIQSLSVSHNSLKLMKWMNCLPNLKSLNLSNCQISLLPSDMFNFTPNLEILQLDYNQLSKWSQSIFSCTKLRKLTMIHNELEELPSEIEKLPNLEILNLQFNKIQKISKSVWNVPLTDLNLCSNLLSIFPLPNVGTDDELSRLPFPSSLKKLNLCDNQLTDDILDLMRFFPHLETLNLSYNDLIDIGSEELINLKNLKNLYLSGNHLTALPEDLTSLSVFFVDDNKLSNIPAEIADNTNLMIFDTSNNILKYNINNWPYDWNWNYNAALKYLNLSGNKKLDIRVPLNVEEEGPLASFEEMNSIKFLDLSFTNFDKGILPEENGMRRVRHLTSSEPMTTIFATVECPDVENGEIGSWDFVVPSFLGFNKECLLGIFEKNNNFLTATKEGEPVDDDLEIPKYLAGAFPFIFGTELRKVKPEEILLALKRSFLNLNRDLSLTFFNTEKGCSAAIVYIKDSRIFIGNVGDVSVVMSRGGKAKILSKLHNPDFDEEFKRIRAVNGFVASTINEDPVRLDGELKITRAFGHFNKTPIISADPFLDEIEIEENDGILIIASAEFFNCVPAQRAIEVALLEKANMSAAAHKLRAMAIGAGREKSFTLTIININVLSSSSADFDFLGSGHGGTGIGIGKIERSGKRRGVAGSSHTAFLRDNLLTSDISAVHEIPPPIGEITMVFTHIVNSFVLWEAFPEAMPEAVRCHNAIMRSFLPATCGYEVKTDSDVFMIAFPTVSQALQWCCLVQKQLLEADWPEELLNHPDGHPVSLPNDPNQLVYRGLSVKMGIHCGIPICEMDPITRRMDYFGSVVNRSARVRSAALGGEICLSNEAYTAWMQNPTFDVDIYCLGRVKLKGVDNLELIYIAYPPELSARQAYRNLYEQANQIEEISSRLTNLPILSSNSEEMDVISQEKRNATNLDDALEEVNKDHDDTVQSDDACSTLLTEPISSSSNANTSSSQPENVYVNRLSLAVDNLQSVVGKLEEKVGGSSPIPDPQPSRNQQPIAYNAPTDTSDNVIANESEDEIIIPLTHPRASLSISQSKSGRSSSVLLSQPIEFSSEDPFGVSSDPFGQAEETTFANESEVEEAENENENNIE